MIGHSLHSSVIMFLLIGILFIAPGMTAYAQTNPEHVRSEVYIDRSDKQSISGITEIAFAWGQLFDPPQDLLRGVINLKEAMNRWTDVVTTLNQHLLLSDPGIRDLPFMFVTADKVFDLTEAEKRNLREYFSSGGFMFLDNSQPQSEFSASGASLRKMLEDVIPNALFAPIPDNHQIYHSFFDFDDGPPQGSEVNLHLSVGKSNSGDSVRIRAHRMTMNKQVLYLEGAWLEGDLVAVYSDKGYIVKWNDTSNNEPQLRMGVNLIIYALTRGPTNAIKNYR
ncbi:DUF4159 domain-containing protein [Candidatus Latescibacterota bacterium]